MNFAKLRWFCSIILNKIAARCWIYQLSEELLLTLVSILKQVQLADVWLRRNMLDSCVNRYASLRRRLLIDPHLSKDGTRSPDLTMDNPLSQNPGMLSICCPHFFSYFGLLFWWILQFIPGKLYHYKYCKFKYVICNACCTWRAIMILLWVHSSTSASNPIMVNLFFSFWAIMLICSI